MIIQQRMISIFLGDDPTTIPFGLLLNYRFLLLGIMRLEIVVILAVVIITTILLDGFELDNATLSLKAVLKRHLRINCRDNLHLFLNRV
jgi:hypothetical protein